MAALAKFADVVGNRFIDVRLLSALRREIARGLHGEVDRGPDSGSGKGEVRWIARALTIASQSPFRT